MKIKAFICFGFSILHCILLNSQNVEDAYATPATSPEVWPNSVGYTGEYQIFTDKFFWNMCWDYNMHLAAVSSSIEVVSYPFIPTGDLTDPPLNRVLTTAITNNAQYYGAVNWPHLSIKSSRSTLVLVIPASEKILRPILVSLSSFRTTLVL
jgi:hypothetical protein